jgi:CRISPR-associated exonuclease Cas4
MADPVLLIALALLGLALLAWLLARALRRGAGLPAGRIVYADTGNWRPNEQPLFSRKLLLTGKPDYLVEHRGLTLPVEVKSGQAPPGGPHAAHVLQLAAYCALVTEQFGRRPRHGLIRYADRTLAVDYTPALEAALHAALADLRADAQAAGSQAVEIHRSHESAGRCQGCGFRPICAEALA